MKKTSARLGLPGAMGRQQFTEGTIAGEETNSASLARAEREIKSLKAENSRLRNDLEDVRSLYNQLMQERSHENFDERRVTLLKSQIIQLERQVLLLSEALSGRGEVLMEVENSLTWLADKFRSYIVKDVRGAEVNVARSDLTLMVETAESARIKLFKRLEVTPDKLARPLLFYNEFLRQSNDTDVTWLDVSYGNLNHINMKHVTKLETKLSQLYKELIHLHGALENDGKTTGSIWSSGHVILAARERLSTRLLKSCAMMKDCTSDLLDLSLLFPSAPWPPLKKPAIKEVTSERVLKCLPTAVRSRTGETQQVIQALVKAYNYRVYMLDKEVKALRAELKYHQTTYDIQLHYIDALFSSIREAYSNFEESSNEVIVEPLKDILEAYVELSTSASEESLKDFLSKFKETAPQLHDIVETIGMKTEESEGAKTLSSFGEAFFASMDKLVREQQRKRDQAASKMEEIRAEQEILDRQLQEILEEQEQQATDSEANISSRLADTSTQEEETSRVEYCDKKQKTVTITEQAREVSKTRTKNRFPKSVPNTEPSSSASSPSSVATPDNKPDDEDSPSELKKKINNQRPDWDNTLYESLSTEKQDLPSTPDNREEESQCSKPDKTTSDSVSTDPETVDKPLTVKPTAKKKLGYVPNTFIPNRTLKLRRSGSLTRLANDVPVSKTVNQSLKHDTDDKDEVAKVKKTGAPSRGRSGSRDRSASKLPLKTKPKFK